MQKQTIAVGRTEPSAGSLERHKSPPFLQLAHVCRKSDTCRGGFSKPSESRRKEHKMIPVKPWNCLSPQQQDSFFSATGHLGACCWRFRTAWIQQPKPPLPGSKYLPSLFQASVTHVPLNFGQIYRLGVNLLHTLKKNSSDFFFPSSAIPSYWTSSLQCLQHWWIWCVLE